MLSWIPRVAHGNVKSINLVERKQSQVNDSHYNGEVGRAAQLTLYCWTVTECQKMTPAMNQIFVWAGQLTCASNVYIDVTMEVNEFLPAGARIKMILTFYFYVSLYTFLKRK